MPNTVRMSPPLSLRLKHWETNGERAFLLGLFQWWCARRGTPTHGVHNIARSALYKVLVPPSLISHLTCQLV